MNTQTQRNYSDLDQFITDTNEASLIEADMEDILLDLEMMQPNDIDQELTEYYRVTGQCEAYQLTNQGE